MVSRMTIVQNDPDDRQDDDGRAGRGRYNCLFLLGPTAVGKTALGVRLAVALGGEILSADSRQVYVGLDIGSGKDLADYAVPHDLVASLNPALAARCGDTYQVPYHLIDVAALPREYNLFDYQEDFYRAFSAVQSRGSLSVVVGGTGMYLDCILRQYDLLPTPENPMLRAELEQKSYDELKALLIAEKPDLHNTTDFADKARIIQAIEINRYRQSPACAAYKAARPPRPELRPLVLGTTLPRPLVRERIARRLRERLDAGLIAEVEQLHANGVSWERLDQLGLEYRFVSAYLQGTIADKDALFEKLALAIGQFAKRQETWFRGMERKGIAIRWLPETAEVETRFSAAMRLATA